MSAFTPAVRRKLNLRIAVEGPTGSGKTLQSLLLAYGLSGDWSKIFVIDTDNRMALAYANDPVFGIGQFMHAPIEAPYTAQKFINLGREAVNAGASVIIFDTLTHVWAGKGGLLEKHDTLKGNDYTNWGKINPEWFDLIDFITTAPCDVIATMRAKMAHALNEVTQPDGTKKTTVERLGLAPIIRPNTEYEFMLTLELDRDTHKGAIITKRGTMLPDMGPVSVGVETGKLLKAWAVSGADAPPEDVWKQGLAYLGATKDQVASALGTMRVSEWIAGAPGRTVTDALDLVRVSLNGHS